MYRVLDLPSSMRTLVYDYGSLHTGAESVYIKRIVENHVNVCMKVVDTDIYVASVHIICFHPLPIDLCTGLCASTM